MKQKIILEIREIINDYQNGTIETVAFCDEKEFAEHCAEALNILFNLNNDGIETKEN